MATNGIMARGGGINSLSRSNFRHSERSEESPNAGRRFFATLRMTVSQVIFINTHMCTPRIWIY